MVDLAEWLVGLLAQMRRPSEARLSGPIPETQRPDAKQVQRDTRQFANLVGFDDALAFDAAHQAKGRGVGLDRQVRPPRSEVSRDTPRRGIALEGDRDHGRCAGTYRSGLSEPGVSDRLGSGGGDRPSRPCPGRSMVNPINPRAQATRRPRRASRSGCTPWVDPCN